MIDSPADPDSKAIFETVAGAERQAAEYREFLTKLSARLTRAMKALASRPGIGSEIGRLVTDLHAMKSEPTRPVLGKLIESLEKQLSTLNTGSEERFASGLRQRCEDEGLEFKSLPDGFGIGPFNVGIKPQVEVASFEYAKVPILKDVPRNASAILASARSLKASLLDPPVDLPTFRRELHEAMRVALARRENSPATTKLRVELPVVFREMGFIRSSTGVSGKRKRMDAEYPMSRFVIELKQFIQSDQNLNANQQFQLEPAVIENTKNSKKSIFIPRDISCGFGEGTYYQAVVLQGR